MEVEKLRGYIAAIVAALCVIGGGAAAVYLWSLPPTDPPRDLGLIFGVLGGLIGSGTTFLFVAEGASRATHAAERSFETGTAAGAAMPGQTQVEPIGEDFTANTPEPDIEADAT